MENFSNTNPNEKIKKIYKAGVVDVSSLAEAQARDVADSRMTESKEDREKNWFTRTAKRIWKHNMAEEWYRQREIQRAQQEISESGDLYAGETKDGSLKNYEEAKKAIIERFTSEYEIEMLKEEEKNSKKTITDEKSKSAIKDLIKKFATDPNMPETTFIEEQNRILAFSNPEYIEKGKMYASNLLDIAKEIRNSVSHGEKLAEMDFDVEVTLGKARESLNTEAKHNTFEKIVEKTQNSKLGKYLFNEPAAVSIAAGLYSAGNFLGMKALRSKVAQWGTFGATAILAGGVSAAKEAARLNRERAQHARESAKGVEFKESDMKRRQEMEENRYETKNASEVIKILESDLAKVSTGKVSEEDLNAVLVNLSDVEARIKFGDTNKIDLIAYSRFSEIEKERMNLDLCRAKIKVAIRKGIEDKRIEFTKGTNFDMYLSQLVDVQSKDNLSKDMEEKDRIFKAMKHKKVAAAFVKTVLIGASMGVAFQEIHAAFQPGTDGVVEGAVKHFTHHQGNLAQHSTALENLRRYIMHEKPIASGEGHGTITEHITRNTQEYLNKHPELTTKIHREIWMANNTPMHPDPNHPGHLLGADFNELRTQWGGVHGTGIDEHGNYVFNVQHMTNDGSFEKTLSIAAHDQMKKGGLTLLLSVTKGLEHNVFKVPIDANGNAIIDPHSPIGEMMFQNNNGHAIFTGQFAEIAHQTGVAGDGGENMQILSTYVGTGRPGDIIENVIHNTPNTPINWDYKVPPFIPVGSRRPLEKGKNPKEDVPTAEYFYGGFSDIQREDYEKRMSETLRNNPDANLDEKKEIKDYFARQTKEHLEIIKKLVAQAGPMSKDCKLSVCIPVAGHQEEKNIYKTLENYLNQTANKNSFEIALFVNYPDKDKSGKKINPDGTISEIKRFKKDHPEINIVVMKKIIPLEKVCIGYVRKLLNDAVLQRNIQRGNNAPDHIMLSNDADNRGVSSEYIENFIRKFRENSKIDSSMGQLDWDPESYIRNPLVHVGTRLFQYVGMQLRHKNIPSSGANFAFRSSIYAAVNGYSNDIRLGEDVDLGRAIKASRVGAKKRKAIAFAGARVSRLFTSSRRAEKAIKDGLSPVEQWSSGFSAFDDEVRKVNWASVSNRIDYKNKESVKILITELEKVINRTLKAMTWTNGDLKLFDRALGWLGIKYKLTGTGAFQEKNTGHVSSMSLSNEPYLHGENSIKITDATKLIKGLEQYQKEGLEILRKKTVRRGKSKKQQVKVS
jgi:hypothetical protein